MSGEQATPTQKTGFRIMPVHALTIMIIIAAAIGVFFVTTSNATPTVVANGDNVSVIYTGAFTNGTVFDSNVGKQPLTFIVGSGQLIKGFDSAVIGMKLNQTKNVTIPPAEGYGMVNESLIVPVPRSQFGNQTVHIGMGVTSQGGQRGTITAINATTVTVDFNSPLAGKTLVFEIKVVAISR